LSQLVHSEAEEVVPGLAELVNVLWELGILPDVRVLPQSGTPQVLPAPTRGAAITEAIGRFMGAQWAFWPAGAELAQRVRALLDQHFDELFVADSGGFTPGWLRAGREVLITWRPGLDRRVA